MKKYSRISIGLLSSKASERVTIVPSEADILFSSMCGRIFLNAIDLLNYLF